MKTRKIKAETIEFEEMAAPHRLTMTSDNRLFLSGGNDAKRQVTLREALEWFHTCLRFSDGGFVGALDRLVDLAAKQLSA